MKSPRKKILLVEDNEIDRRIMEGVLRKRDFQVITLNEGKDCIETVKLKKPDLVLLDVMMPGIPGNRLLHMLREKHSSVELPVLMTTVKTNASDIMESLSLGANDYITKPIDFDVALMRIQTHLTISEQAKEIARLHSLESVAALISTYNHEINNPLAIAISSLKSLEPPSHEKAYRRIESALWRIAGIVKRIKESTQGVDLQFEKYGESGKILKLK